MVNKVDCFIKILLILKGFRLMNFRINIFKYGYNCIMAFLHNCYTFLWAIHVVSEGFTIFKLGGLVLSAPPAFTAPW